MTLSPLLNEAALDAALIALRQVDPTLIIPLTDRVGRPALRLRSPDFAGLASIVVAQQVSTASAAAMFSRLQAAGLAEPLAFLDASDEALRSCGLSLAKSVTLRAAARAIAAGDLPLGILAALPAADARIRLMTLPGIGPWTAEVFLLFCLGHVDAWPAGDLALQEAARLALALPARPAARDLTRIGERWRPFRGAAAYLLWAYYRLCKGREAT